MCRRPWLSLVAVVVLAVGCATITKEARIYDMTGGTVIHATFEARGAQGPVTATLPSGAKCHGEYSTLRAGARAWGSIYDQAGGTGVNRNVAVSNKQGSAVVVCDGGFTMECEYLSGPTSGNGFCNDNRGGRYRLMF